jgi:hypothetical protein
MLGLQFISKSGPALATGATVSTITVVEEVAVQPLVVFVAIKLYVVVTSGFAVGFDAVVEFNPVAGDHE